MTCPGTLSGTMSHRDEKSVKIPQSLGDRGTVPISLKRKRESAEPDLARASRFLSVRAGAQVRQRPPQHRFTASNHQGPAFKSRTQILSQVLALLDRKAVGVSGGPKALGLLAAKTPPTPPRLRAAVPNYCGISLFKLPNLTT